MRDYIRHETESSVDFQMTLDKSGKIMDVNEAFELIVGKRREDIIGTSICQYMQEDAEEAIAQIFEVEKVRDIELTVDLPGKGTLIGNFYGAVFTTPEGEFGIYITGRDITDRKKAEEELKESQRYTRGLIDASPDPLVTISAEGKITDVNHATELVTGYPREKLIGSEFSHYFSDPQKARQGYQQVFKDGYVRDYPLEIKHGDGKVTPVLYNASVYYDAKGEVAGVFAAARDISERKKAEKKWMLFSQAVDSSIEGIAMGNLEDMIIYVNETFVRMFGYSREELIGKEIPHIYPEDQLSKLEEALKATMDGGWTGELVGKRKDGELFPMAISSSRIVDNEGNVVAHMASHQDITERKHAEEELKKRNEALKRFNKLAVGRELKMIELKSEINALLEQLGKEPRYRIAGEGDKRNYEL